MRPRDPFPSDVASESRRLMKSASSQSAFRRFQVVFLAASEHRQDVDIAGITGLSERYIRSILARCRQGGVASLADKLRGGRRRERLSPSDEQSFLQSFFEQAARGGVLIVSEIHRALEKRVGRSVPLSGIYKLLHRHGWRKIAPRRRHPLGKPEQQAEFKKNLAKRLGSRRTR